MKQKGSSDIKGSLWNHLGKKVLLRHLFKSIDFYNISDNIQTPKLPRLALKACEKQSRPNRDISRERDRAENTKCFPVGRKVTISLYLSSSYPTRVSVKSLADFFLFQRKNINQD